MVLVVLIVLLLVAPYIMWKHRVILVMKIVHYFQKYEDDGINMFCCYLHKGISNV